MIGVLPENHHFHLREGACVESRKNPAGRRVNGGCGIGIAHKLSKPLEIRGLKLIGEYRLPC